MIYSLMGPDYEKNAAFSSIDYNEISIKTGIKHIALHAGRSSQATLLGKNEITYESLYISNDLYQKNYIFYEGQKENELFTRVS